MALLYYHWLYLSRKKVEPKLKSISISSIFCFFNTVPTVLSVRRLDFMRLLVVFSPVRYLSQVSDSSTLHPVQLLADHGLGIVEFILGDFKGHCDSHRWSFQMNTHRASPHQHLPPERLRPGRLGQSQPSLPCGDRRLSPTVRRPAGPGSRPKCRYLEWGSRSRAWRRTFFLMAAGRRRPPGLPQQRRYRLDGALPAMLPCHCHFHALYG